MWEKLLVMSLFLVLLIPISQAHAASNPNLFVSAENSKFNNYFTGSMVVEVVIRDSSIHDTNEGKGEPDVTINGKSLRMVQASDGNWYAYFANVNKAKIADATVPSGEDGKGKGLDFGVFCSRDSTVFGIDLSETDGVAIPREGNLVGFTNGNVSFSSCTGSLDDPNEKSINNVVRKAKSINKFPSNDSAGQIGLNPAAWPLIQLFSFNDVSIKYNPGGGVQQVDLQYDDIPNIAFNIDRTEYPQNSEVFLTINDFQLNQDPTDEDSWTFNIDSPAGVFYQAYDNSGKNSANGSIGLVNLKSYLPSLGFEENGALLIDLGNVIELQGNEEQPSTSVSNGAGNSYSKIVTLVEEGPNSGIFDTSDYTDKSTIKILSNAPRGQTGNINYNSKSLSVLTGFSTASVSVSDKPSLTIGDGSTLRSGVEYPVILTDNDQNINSGSREHLDVFRESAIIPSLTIGNPITLESAENVKFYAASTDNLLTGGQSAISSVPDKKSDRLIIDSSSLTNGQFEKISMSLGVSASKLQSMLIDNSKSNSDGTNWINYDLRSFDDLEVSDYSDASIDLYFGSLSSSPIRILNSGQMNSHGFIQLSDSIVKEIFSKSGSVYVVINLDSSNDSFGVGNISNETKKQPIVIDFFSFGLVNNDDINNAIYRFELEETNANSSTFDGTLEFAITNQLNILDPSFIGTIKPIDDQVKFIVTNRLVDEKGISISYSDLAEVGVVITTSAKSDIKTNSGIVTLDSSSVRFGQPVTFTLIDPDLNLKSEQIDSYHVIDNPASPGVDTVGKDNTTLLEILIKDIRYKRCTINGVEYGGLASTGFSLVETGTNTGIFKGVFKMPSQICDKTGTKLISSAGGSLDAKYYDARDSSGEPNIFRLSSFDTTSQYSTTPELNQKEIILPSKGNSEDVILSGNISNHKIGLPLDLVLIHPDGLTQKFSASLTSNGSYKALFSLNNQSLIGNYEIQLFHNNINLGTVTFQVKHPNVPDWIKNNAKWWSNDEIPDSEFISGLENLIENGIIKIPTAQPSSTSLKEIPGWIKTTAKWWSNDEISDDEFILAIEYLIKKGVILI